MAKSAVDPEKGAAVSETEAETTQKTDDAYLDVIADNVPNSFLSSTLPFGVCSINSLEDLSYRVTFYPLVIGARDLMARNWGQPIRLAPEVHDGGAVAERQHVLRMALVTLLSIILTMPVLVLAWSPLKLPTVISGSISLAFATLVQILVAGPFYPSAYHSLVHEHTADVDVLIVLSTTTAYVYSVIAFAYQVDGRPLATGMFFQTSTLLTTIVMIGRLIGDYAHQRALETISIRSLQTPVALLMDKESTLEIDTRLLQYGDLFKVLPDATFPTDGVVETGHSEVDESMITGEAMLVEKRPGSSVLAGTLNHWGVLSVRLTRLPGQNTVSNIATMVDEAQRLKPRSQEIADRVAAWFVPTIVVITIITFIAWVIIGKTEYHRDAETAVVIALTYAIATLIVSCPCAIGLAVPMVVVIASGVAAKHGVIIKTGRMIEIARSVDHIVFDKTGTLTQGRLSVVHEFYLSESEESIKQSIWSLTSSTKHPVACAVAAHLKTQLPTLVPQNLEGVTVFPGQGVEGICDGKTLRAGNSRWIRVENNSVVQQLLSYKLSVFCVSTADQLVAIYGLQDSLRPEASKVISILKSRGITVSLLSGDDDQAVSAVASQLEILPANVRPSASPAEKRDYVKALLSASTTGGQAPTVLFCGDGTNDAVALAQATVGVHMSGGTDIARGVADIVLTTPSLQGLLTLLDISQAAFRRIILNFFWSFFYNVFAILLAAGAFSGAGFTLQPQYAAVGELVSIVPVILVALQMKYKHWGK